MLRRFDFTAMAGIPAILAGAPGVRCAKCGWETLPGDVIKRALTALTVEVARYPARLSADLAKFLRKRLGLTQQDLAERMGIGREWVAKWECGMADISPSHDAILRWFALGHSVEPAFAEEILRTIRQFDHLRTAPPKVPEPFQIEALKRLRGRASDSSDPS